VSVPTPNLESLLYDGESVVEVVDCAAGRVAVTSHRLLALTPDGDGPNVRTVERPNVESVGTTRVGGERAAEVGIKAGVVGVVAVVVAPFAAIDIPPVSGGAVGLDGLTALFDLLTRLDDALRLLGVAGLVVAFLAGAWVLHAREKVVGIGVAGGDDLLVAADDPDAVAAALESALRRADTSASSPPTT
jgi:hypothetical protein